MEKTMENEMETGGIYGLRGLAGGCGMAGAWGAGLALGGEEGWLARKPVRDIPAAVLQSNRDRLNTSMTAGSMARWLNANSTRTVSLTSCSQDLTYQEHCERQRRNCTCMTPLHNSGPGPHPQRYIADWGFPRNRQGWRMYLGGPTAFLV